MSGYNESSYLGGIARIGTEAPIGPASGFGREVTADDFGARIVWERWAASEQRRIGCEALAQAHDLARTAYEELAQLKGFAY